MKKPKPIASSLRRKSGWVITWSRSIERDDRAGDERAEDHLEPELLGDRREADEQDERRADADLRGRVLQPQQVGADADRALGAADDEEDDDRASANSAPSSSSVEPVPPSPEKKIVSRMIAPKSAIEAGGDDQLAERRGDLAGVLEHRHEHAERRRAEDDRDQQRRVDQARRLQPERDDDRDRRTRARSRAA